MPASSTIKLNSPMQQNSNDLSGAVVPDVCELNRMAIQGLVPMFVPEKNIFCFRVQHTKQGLVKQGLSPRYTIMTLLGLREVERTGARTPFDVNSIYETLAKDTAWIQGAGDLGLMIWLTAVFAPDQIDGFFSRMKVESALEQYADAREARTMELAWFLTGLAHAGIACPEKVSGLRKLADKAY